MSEAENLIEYDKYYYVSNICPYCKHSKIVKIEHKSGFFDLGWKPDTYKCSRCSREFKSSDSLSVVPRKEVTRLVQSGLNGKMTQDEMLKGFNKIGIYLHKPYRKMKK